MEQIQVKRFLDHEISTDLFIVNAARVSFAKRKEVFDASDQGLLGFLAREAHKTPFRHPRVLIELFVKTDALLKYISEDPFQGAGMILQGTFLSCSVLNIVQMIRYDWGDEHFNKDLESLLCNLFPATARAWGQQNEDPLPYEFFRVIPNSNEYARDNDLPWFDNLSFHCRAPIWLTRQLVKHSVGLSWSETSRRYVGDDIELFDQEIRVAPLDGIKQGSGDVTEFYPTVLTGGYMHHSISHISQCLTSWYRKCIKEGLAPETVRGYQQLNMMTEWIWSGPRPCFENVIHERLGSGAQKEAKNFARKMRGLM